MLFRWDISWLLNIQVIVNGRSPKFTVHATCRYSPTFVGLSPNENGKILGGTENN